MSYRKMRELIATALQRVRQNNKRLDRFVEQNNVEGFKQEFAKRRNRAAEQHVLRAASLGRLRLLKYLLGHIHVEPQTRIAALRAAIRAGQLDAVALLHQTGADLNSAPATFFNEAIAYGAVDVTRYLHEHGIGLTNVSAEAMTEVARRGHVSVLKYLHTNGMTLTQIGPALLRGAVQDGQLGLIK